MRLALNLLCVHHQAIAGIYPCVLKLLHISSIDTLGNHCVDACFFVNQRQIALGIIKVGLDCAFQTRLMFGETVHLAKIFRKAGEKGNKYQYH